MAYKGKFTPKHPEKYVGDVKNIVYRSLWERNTFRWIDQNSNIKEWNSEEVVVPYICGTDNRRHRYFMDLWFRTRSGETYIVEIKPKKETNPPKKPSGRQTRKYVQESLTYVKNQSKWAAAQEFALNNGWRFEVWTEDTLKQLGIKILNNSPAPRTKTKTKSKNRTDNSNKKNNTTSSG